MRSTTKRRIPEKSQEAKSITRDAMLLRESSFNLEEDGQKALEKKKSETERTKKEKEMVDEILRHQKEAARRTRSSILETSPLAPPPGTSMFHTTTTSGGVDNQQQQQQQQQQQRAQLSAESLAQQQMGLGGGFTGGSSNSLIQQQSQQRHTSPTGGAMKMTTGEYNRPQPDFKKTRSFVKAASGAFQTQRAKEYADVPPPSSPEEIMMRQYYFEDFQRANPEMQRKLKKSCQILASNYNEKEVVEFLTAEHDLRRFQREIKSQVDRIENAATVTEKEVNNIVTDKASRTTQIIGGAGGVGADDTLVEHAGYLGPPLQEMGMDERIQECRGLLLRGAPELSEETKFVAHVTVFASPFATLTTSCTGIQKLIIELYSNCQELAANVNPEKADTLKTTINNVRRCLSSQFVFLDAVYERTGAIQNNFENLESDVQANVLAKQHAVRVGKELQKENETLRHQLYQTAVRGGEEKLNKALSGDVDQKATFRYMVMLQAENLHTLRLQKPQLVSEALSLIQNLVESLLQDFSGKRVNFNSTAETMEPFNKKTNRRFPPESYFVEFGTAGQAIEFSHKVQVSLMKIRWPTKILDMEDFCQIENPENPGNDLWKGVRLRAVAHVGTPVITTPHAGSKEGIVNVPYYGGTAVDRLSTLLSRARGGEVVVTARMADSFNGERFKEPNLAQGITLVERASTAIMQTALGEKEKIYTVSSVLLQPRRRPEDKFTYHPAYQCVFPSTTFFRDVDALDDLTLEFEDDDYKSEEVRMSAFQYEELLTQIKKENDELQNKLVKKEEVSHELMLEIQSVRDDLLKERVAHQATEKTLHQWRTKAKLFESLYRKGNIATMRGQDALVSELEDAVNAAEELKQGVEELKAVEQARLDELATHTFEEIAVGEDEPLPPKYFKFLAADSDDSDDESASYSSTLQSPKRMQSTYDSKGGLGTTDCMNCKNKRQTLYNFHQMMNTVQSAVGEVLLGAIDETSLMQKFMGSTVPVLEEDEEDLDTDDPELLLKSAKASAPTFNSLIDAACDEPTPITLGLSFCGHVAKVMNHIKHYEILREVSRRRKQMIRGTAENAAGESDGASMSLDEYTDELDFLSQMNEKLQKDLDEYKQVKGEEIDYLKTKIARLSTTAEDQTERSIKAEDELELRTQTLTLKLRETSARSTKFYNETCRLIKQLHDLKDASTEAKKIKSEFVSLANMVDLQNDEREVNQVLRNEAHQLEAAKAELEKRLVAKDELFKLKDQVIDSLKDYHKDELEQQQEKLQLENSDSTREAVASALKEQASQFETYIKRLGDEEQKRDQAKLHNFKKREAELLKRQQEEIQSFYEKNPPSRVDGLDKPPERPPEFNFESSLLDRRGEDGATPATTTPGALTEILGGGFDDFMARMNSMSMTQVQSESVRSDGGTTALPLASGGESSTRRSTMLRMDNSGEAPAPPASHQFTSLPSQLESKEDSDGVKLQYIIQEKLVEVSCPQCAQRIEQVMQLTPRAVGDTSNTSKGRKKSQSAANGVADPFGSQATVEEEELEKSLMSFKSSSNLTKHRPKSSSVSGGTSLSKKNSTVSPSSSKLANQRAARRSSRRSSIATTSGGARSTGIRTPSGTDIYIDLESEDEDDLEQTFQKSASGSFVGALSRGIQSRSSNIPGLLVSRGVGTALSVQLDDDFVEVAQTFVELGGVDGDYDGDSCDADSFSDGFGGGASTASGPAGKKRPGTSATRGRPTTGFTRGGQGAVMAPGGKVRKGSNLSRRPHSSQAVSRPSAADADFGELVDEGSLDGSFQIGKGKGGAVGGKSSTTTGAAKKRPMMGRLGKPMRSVAQMVDMKRPKTAQPTPGEAAQAVGMLSGGGVKRPPMLRGAHAGSGDGAPILRGDGDDNDLPFMSQLVGGTTITNPTLIAQNMHKTLHQYEGKDSQVTNALLAGSSAMQGASGTVDGPNSPSRSTLSPEQQALIDGDDLHPPGGMMTPVHETRVSSAHNKNVPANQTYTTVRPKQPKIGVRGKSPPRTGSPHPRPTTPPNSRQAMTYDLHGGRTNH